MDSAAADSAAELLLPDKTDTDVIFFSEGGGYGGVLPKRMQRSAKKRADIKVNVQSVKQDSKIEPSGNVWACCCSSEILLSELRSTAQRRVLKSSRLELRFEVFFTDVFMGWMSIRDFVNPTETTHQSTVCIFKFGCIAAWDLPSSLRGDLLALLEPFLKDALPKLEEDAMSYVWAYERAIKQDVIHLVSTNKLELLAYSYAFAQSCKLTVFEDQVDDAIDRTRAIPENLARTGKIPASRAEIAKRIGELFTSRFYINLHTDILDTPDVFWEFDEFADHYTYCRSYLELSKRVEILNQRLDIMKDLYDMLNQELTIEHGYKLEWIVIYLILVEVFIEVIWGILIRDLLKLV